ncbi:MAG TPA: SCO family protein [Chloroflexota bacterium]|nr:SCO family protein [Chloroflexota bacterium]
MAQVRTGAKDRPGAIAAPTRRPRRGLALLLALAALAAACGSPPPLAGTDLGQTPAPDFTLTDQNGDALQLSALRGRPIALTFLYTQCPDVCPLTADKLRRTADLLGSAADQVAFVAVSVDPPHDDAAAAQAFVAQHRLTGRLRYLVGTQAELQPVWSAYYMYVAPSPSDDPAERAAANYAARTATHTDALFVIDRQGRERTLLRSDFEPEALASTLKRLLGE